MKSNLIKTITRTSTILTRNNKTTAVSKPHYYPSKQITTAKKDFKPSSLGYFINFD
ncbi:MAG: hypothetical protein AB7V50_11350 [Vampirovibrionia bacterium]